MNSLDEIAQYIAEESNVAYLHVIASDNFFDIEVYIDNQDCYATWESEAFTLYDAEDEADRLEIMLMSHGVRVYRDRLEWENLV